MSSRQTDRRTVRPTDSRQTEVLPMTEIEKTYLSLCLSPSLAPSLSLCVSLFLSVSLSLCLCLALSFYDRVHDPAAAAPSLGLCSSSWTGVVSRILWLIINEGGKRAVAFEMQGERQSPDDRPWEIYLAPSSLFMQLRVSSSLHFS